MIKVSRPALGLEEANAVAAVLASGWLTNGPVVREFEEAFAAYTGWDYAIATNSATAASALIMDWLHLGPAHKVLVPNLTFSSPVIQLVKRGVQVIVGDVDPETLCLSTKEASLPEDLPDFVMPTDYAGLRAPWSGTSVIRDAACHIGRDDGDCLAAFVSFYANKVLTTGEGGMLLTNNKDLWLYARQARLHGISADAHGREALGLSALGYDLVTLGHKANMSDISAALGLVQLAKVDVLLEAREKIFFQYVERLEDLVRFQNGGMNLPHSHCMVPVFFNSKHQRDTVHQKLYAANIGVSLHYPLLTSLTALRPYLTPLQTPVANAAVRTMLSLPVYPGLLRSEVDRICDVIGQAIG